jgi:propanediol dehydratase small subunit
MGPDRPADYPLGTEHPELVTTPSGLRLDEVTLDALRTGRLTSDQIRATPETLRRQAEIARAAGREPLAANLERAAELAEVPADTILAIYTALRPHRSTGEELQRWAERLEAEFSAPLSAAFVREAAVVYAERGLLGERDPAQV